YSFRSREIGARRWHQQGRCGWHGGAGCARAVDRPRHTRTVPSGGKRTGRRARDPDPGTGPAALRMPPMPIDRPFSRRAGFQAYLIAAFSLVYAVVFLGFVRNHPENTQAAALAWALIAGNASWPRNLGWLAALGGLDLIVLFFATVAAYESLILVSGGLASVILVPAFWIWTGRLLRASAHSSESRSHSLWWARSRLAYRSTSFRDLSPASQVFRATTPLPRRWSARRWVGMRSLSP